MVSHSLPSPPADDQKTSPSRKMMPPKSAKSTHRISKRGGKEAAKAPIPSQDAVAHPNGVDSRHKRVWKACERCRMKKTKCDGEDPCKRCMDDGVVCAASLRKKVEYKQLPKGYAEVLENTQLALVATIHRLYGMVRNGESWDLEEPQLNERGQPVIHHIARTLGCIRPNNDIDLPVPSTFPETDEDMNDMARKLHEQHAQQASEVTESAVPPGPTSRSPTSNGLPSSTGSSSQRTSSSESNGIDMYSFGHGERASSSELDHSDFEGDYRKYVFGGSNTMDGAGSNGMMMSPRSYGSGNDFDSGNFPMASTDVARGMFSTAQSPASPTFATWPQSVPQQQAMGGPRSNTHFQVQQQPSQGPQPQPMLHQQRPSLLVQQQQPPVPAARSLAFYTNQDDLMQGLDMLNEGIMESNFGMLKPHVISCSNPEAMLGMGDPMIYSGQGHFDADHML